MEFNGLESSESDYGGAAVIHRKEEISAIVSSIMLDFTLPSNPSIKLIPNGDTIGVSIDNVLEYITRVLDMVLGSGVQRQFNALRAGFNEVRI